MVGHLALPPDPQADHQIGPRADRAVPAVAQADKVVRAEMADSTEGDDQFNRRIARILAATNIS